MIAYFKDFLLFSFFSGFSILILWILRRYTSRKILPGFTYIVHCLGLLLLLFPLFPRHLLADFSPPRFSLINAMLDYIPEQNHAVQSLVESSENMSSSLLEDIGFLQLSSTGETIFYGLLILWAGGVLFALTRFFLALRSVQHLRQSAAFVTDDETLRIWKNVSQTNHLKKVIHLKKSPLITAPMTFGLRVCCVLLPEDQTYTSRQLTHVLLHEQMHCRHLDYFWNAAARLIACFYWFHPVIQLFIRSFQQEQELYCDHSVLRLLDEKEITAYGMTLLQFVSRNQNPAGLSFRMSSSHKLLKRRILQISSYSPVKRNEWSRSVISIFLTILVVISGLIPYLASSAQIPHISTISDRPDVSHLVYQNYHENFKDYAGSFVLLDMNTNLYHIYNEDYAFTRLSPASTYKIYNTLFALDAGIITNENSIRHWDGTRYMFKDWNMDQDLQSAMSGSVNWYFEQLDLELGQGALESYMERISYGNMMTGVLPQNCWIDCELAISPLEQVDLLHALYSNALAFHEEDIETVFDALTIYETADIRLVGKTGTSQYQNGQGEGWFVGFVETPENTAWFALYLEGDQAATGKRASEITLDILQDEGWLQTTGS